jgi:hypothetical protein
VTECVHAPNIASLHESHADRAQFWICSPPLQRQPLGPPHPPSQSTIFPLAIHYHGSLVTHSSDTMIAQPLHGMLVPQVHAANCIAWCGGRTCSLCRIQSARAAWLCPSTKQLAIIGSTCHPPHTDCRHLHVQKRCSSCSTHSLWLCARRQSRAPQAARAFRTGHICHSPQAHLHPRVAACACDHSSTSRCVCEARVGRWSSAMQP